MASTLKPHTTVNTRMVCYLSIPKERDDGSKSAMFEKNASNIFCHRQPFLDTFEIHL